MDTPEPVSKVAQNLRAQMRAERWSKLCELAMSRAELLRQVEQLTAERGLSLRRCLAEVAPSVSWSAYLHWRRRRNGTEGPDWEALLDRRMPPKREPIPPEVCTAARMLRRQDRSINTRKSREHLVAEFGASGALSDTTLRRLWSQAGLVYESREVVKPGMPGESVHYSGGAGLALIYAADVELGASLGLARAALCAGRDTADSQGVVEVRSGVDVDEERSERGQFTASYNQAWRQGVEDGATDGRWSTDEEKGRHRDLKTLPTLCHREETLANKMLAMGSTPLLTSRRGFDGLESAAGQWLELLCGHGYMAATLDKTLAELSLLKVGQSMWKVHSGQWYEVSRRWSE